MTLILRYSKTIAFGGYIQNRFSCMRAYVCVLIEIYSTNRGRETLTVATGNMNANEIPNGKPIR